MADRLGKTVLVIDDEPDIRLFLKTLLEDAGFEVSVAANGNEALEKITQKRPDVISLDLVMPKMSGLKFYRYIQKNKERANIPVIVVTAHAKDEFGRSDLDKIRAAQSAESIMLVVEKPIQPASYVNIVRKAAGLDEIVSEETGEKEVLKVKLKEKMKNADKKTLEDVMKMLDKDTEGGKRK